MAFRGMRRGEACGLAWPDLDLAAASLTVRENRVKITYQEIEEGAPPRPTRAATRSRSTPARSLRKPTTVDRNRPGTNGARRGRPEEKCSPGRTARGCTPTT
ncbi:hypothetical protein GCM10010402_37870 [Actinomadura luteofluorescens]